MRLQIMSDLHLEMYAHGGGRLNRPAGYGAYPPGGVMNATNQ
jgi:hypothetical protein